MSFTLAVWICVSAVAGEQHLSESFVWGTYEGHVAITQDYKSAWTTATAECRAEHEEACVTRCWHEPK